MEFLLKVFTVVVVVGLGVLISWFLSTRAWPLMLTSGLDIVLWVTIGSSLVGIFGNGHSASREIVRDLQKRNRRDPPA